MKLVTTFCCAALTLCSAIYAQAPADRMTVHFNTPVIVGETRIPAGDCDIQLMHGNSDNVIMVLRSHGGISTAALVSRLSESSADAVGTGVVLTRRGNDLHLDRILLDDHTGYQLNNVE